MATTRKFGIVTSVTGLTGGICVNSLDFNQQVETATAQNELGQITDMAGYTNKTTLTAQGVLDTAKGELAKAGSILTIGGKNYLITQVSRRESSGENMTGFTCPDCGHTHQLFSKGGGEALARRYSAPLLAQLPINPKFMAFCDNGDLDQALKNAPEICSAMENVMRSVL